MLLKFSKWKAVNKYIFYKKILFQSFNLKIHIKLNVIMKFTSNFGI